MTKRGTTQAKANNKANKPKPAQQALKVAKQVVPKGTASAVGAMLGSLLGPKGALLGGMAGKAIGRISGVGDYTVSANTIHTMGGSTLSGEVPAFGRQNDSTRVRHREFIADVVVPSTPLVFNNTSYVINPSNATLFPWLAKFAENYQQYELKGMVLVFKTTTSDYAASGSLGKIALCTNYNVRDSDFANMQEVENSQFAVSGKPSLSHIHPIECASNNGVPLRKWVRDLQYDASGGDDRLYDVGKFQIATSGLPMAPGTVIGELWVSYDFEFFKPVVGRSTEALYEPVSVPVFDQVTGSFPNQPIIMSETSQYTAYTAANVNEAYTRMVSPGLYTRVASSTPESAKITRSAWRVTDPDPSTDVDGVFPSYWKAQNELVLQRKGIYFINSIAEPINDVAKAPRTAANYFWAAISNSTTAPSNIPSAWLHHISVDSLDAISGQFRVLSFSGNANNCPPTKNSNVPDGISSGKYYPHSLSWTLAIWLPEDLDNGVSVRFNGDVTNGTSPLSLDGSTNDAIPFFDYYTLKFNISYLNSRLQTYYQPVDTAAATRREELLFRRAVRDFEALLPKMKALA